MGEVHPSVMEEMLRITAGLGPDEFVFVSDDGCPVNLQNFNRRVLQPAAIRAGPPKLTADTLRFHTAVTRTVERLHLVTHREELASWARHSDGTMADVYTRAGDEFDGSELATLNDPVAKRRDRPANVVPIRNHG
jgi:hypothetical protein